MKNVKIFALLPLFLLALFALIACGDKPSDGPIPELDFDKAKANLEKNGCQIAFAAKQGDVEAECYFTAVAEEYGHRDNVHTNNFIPAISPNDVDAALEVLNPYVDIEEIYNPKIVWLKTEVAAKQYYNDMKGSLESDKEEMEYFISKLKEELKNVSAEEKSELEADIAAAQKYIDEYVCGISGKVVWRGFESGIEATRQSFENEK